MIFLALIFYLPSTVKNVPHNIIPLKNNHTQYTERRKERKNVSGVMLLTLGLNNAITVHNISLLSAGVRDVSHMNPSLCLYS